MSVLKHVIAILFLPGIMAIALPALILYSTRSGLGGALAIPLNFIFIMVGLLPVGIALTLMVKTKPI